MIFHNLETERLFLRSVSYEDVEFLAEHFTNEDVNRHLYDEQALKDFADAEGLVEFFSQPEPRTYHRWILVRKCDGAKIGTCGVHCWQVGKGISEIGYDLSPKFWGRGYMTEALRAVIAFAAEEMVLIRLDAHIYPENEKSVRIARKLGFRFMGRTEMYYNGGREYEHHIYELEL